MISTGIFVNLLDDIYMLNNFIVDFVQTSLHITKNLPAEYYIYINLYTQFGEPTFSFWNGLNSTTIVLLQW